MYRLILKTLFVTCMVLWCAGSVRAEESSKLTEANTAFESGDYARAATIYQDLIDQGGASASLFYNLGNSRFRLGENGKAILSYERAKLLSPRDPDLRANLALARKTATVFDKGRYNPWADAALAFLSRNEWSWMAAAAALWIGLMALSGNVLRGSNLLFRKLRWGSVIFAGLILLLGGLVLFLRRDEAQQGIVIVKDAAVRLSPFEKAESIGTPGAGRRVEIGAENAGFFFVHVPGTDLQGWMHRKEVERIEQASSDGS